MANGREIIFDRYILLNLKLKFGFFVFFCLVLSSCSKKIIIPPEKNESPYTKKAREKFQKALNLRQNAAIQAIKVFSEIRGQYPFSKYAILADYEIAETYFLDGNFAQAAEHFDLFIKIYPGHRKAEECYYKIAKSYDEEVPGTLLGLVPPLYVRNMLPIENALTAYYNYQVKYPGGKFSKEVEEKIKLYEAELFSHEFYAMNWYLNEEKYEGAGLRLISLLKKLPPQGRKKYLSYWEQILPKLGKTWVSSHVEERVKMLFPKGLN